MSLAFDEYGRPFIIIRVRARGRRDPSGVAGFPYSPYSPYFALLSSPTSSSTFCADAWLYTFDFRRSERDTGRDGGVCVPAF